jgi:hypothetical protein
MQHSRGNRVGRNFTVRPSEAELEQFKAAGFGIVGPAEFGPWLKWCALQALLLEGQDRHCQDLGPAVPSMVQQLRRGGSANAGGARRHSLAGSDDVAKRVILDLCGGSGAWSKPYRDAGYEVDVITLPAYDVRTYHDRREIHGIIAAPPCEQFSIAKTSGPRDFPKGLETVTACLRVIAECRPAWWALENPASGLLRRWLGNPVDVFQPHHFGDPWTKSTALWGKFALPARSHVKPRSGMPGRRPAERAITPTGFAAAFFAANP